MNESKLLTVKLSSLDYNPLAKEAQKLNLPINIVAPKDYLNSVLKKFHLNLINKKQEKLYLVCGKLAKNCP